MARKFPALLRSFNFEISLFSSLPIIEGSDIRPSGPDRSGVKLGDGAFQECSGLEVEMDVQEYLEGGRNDGVIRRVGRAKFQNIVLKRGMLMTSESSVNRELWNWFNAIVSGVRPVRRYDGIIEVWDVGPTPVASWIFHRGLPAKIVGPQLNAKTGEVAIEELHIAHEGLRLKP